MWSSMDSLRCPPILTCRSHLVTNSSSSTRMPLSAANKPFHVLSLSGAIDGVAATAVTTTLGYPPLAVEGFVTCCPLPALPERWQQLRGSRTPAWRAEQRRPRGLL